MIASIAHEETSPMRRALLIVTATSTLVAGACTDSGASGSSSHDTSASTAQVAGGEETLPTAPESARVDTEKPAFSNPTTVDNPLFPISDLHSAVLLGNEDGHLLRIETTLLPETDTVEIDGEKVETLVSQFVSYLDGRIHEVALDRYAQADDGSVWYFGEDVYNYEDGEVADTDGTWLAGKDGPVAMIMPADPQVDDVYRPENIPDVVFEEVTVKEVGQTVQGPLGPVDGAIVGQELHLLESSYEDKTFAPGYGEFHSGVDGDLEALAVAAPTDARTGSVPDELVAISRGAVDVYDAAAAGDWDAASNALDSMRSAWNARHGHPDTPRLLAFEMDRALDVLAGDPIVPALDDHNVSGTQRAALDVLDTALDLQLQYRPTTDVDRDRFELWTRQILVDAGVSAPEPGPVAGDVTVLEWIRDRITHTFDDPTASQVDSLLDDIRSASGDEDFGTVSSSATDLLDLVSGSSSPA
jgi:hypothetical protein